MSNGQERTQNTRSSPRAIVPLEVDVEVAGETRKVMLVSRDIGAGGMFLRTTEPAPLWKRVRLSIKVPDGEVLEVSGEVVRRVSPEEAREKNRPPGMAVAFDEASRARRKELISLVLDLCSRRPSKEEREHQEAAAEQPAAAPNAEPAEPPVVVVRKKAEDLAPPVGSADDPDDHFSSRTDDLLGQLDDLLDSVEADQPAKPAKPDEPRKPVKPAAPPVRQPAAAAHKPAPAAPKPAPAPPNPAAPKPKEDPFGGLRDFLTGYRRKLSGDTHYDVLLIDRKADAAAIEAAYRRLLARLKPPAPPESLPEDLVRELSAVLGKVRKAFAILGKADRKRAYDFLIDNSDEEF